MFLDTLVNGQGIYKHDTHYFMGCLSISSQLMWFDQLLGSEATSPEDKRRLEADGGRCMGRCCGTTTCRRCSRTAG